MSKMSELDLTVIELRNAAKSLNAVADSLTALFSGNAESKAKPEPVMPPAPTKPVVTLETVRVLLSEKSSIGFTEQVKALLTKYGAAKLSELSPEHYAAVKTEAEAIK
jgi:hypothetical protein